MRERLCCRDFVKPSQFEFAAAAHAQFPPQALADSVFVSVLVPVEAASPVLDPLFESLAPAVELAESELDEPFDA